MTGILITIAILVIVAVVCIKCHCWRRQTDPESCPVCNCKLESEDSCDQCGAARVNFKLEAKP